MNPELNRHLLVETTPRRLLAMPILVALVLWATSILQGNVPLMDDVAYVGMALLLIVWGGRLTADALLNEVQGRTWDSQRLTALGPWSLTLGKLFGATAYVWYSAIVIALAALVFADADPTRLGRLLLTGFFVHSLTLFGALLIHRMNPGSGRMQTPIAQSIGILVGVPFLILDGVPQRLDALLGDLGVLTVFGAPVSPRGFIVALQAILSLWAMWGSARLLRAELRLPQMPIAWPLFLLFAFTLAAAVDPRLLRPERMVPGLLETLARCHLGFLVVVGLTYAAAFFEPKSFVRLRLWWEGLALRDPRRILSLMPCWLVGYGFALIAGLTVIAVWGAIKLGDPDSAAFIFEAAQTEGQIPPTLILTVLLFLARDIGLIYFVTTVEDAERGHFAALVVLGVLHGLLPVILDSLADALLPAGHALWTQPLLAPIPTANPIWMVLPAALQAALVWWITLNAWRRGPEPRSG